MTQTVGYSGTCHTKDAVPGQPRGTCKPQILSQSVPLAAVMIMLWLRQQNLCGADWQFCQSREQGALFYCRVKHTSHQAQLPHDQGSFVTTQMT